MKLKGIDRRITSLVKFNNENKSSDPNRQFEQLKSKCKDFDNNPEEKLFFIFLTTHFDSLLLASDFHKKLDWNKLQKSNKSKIREICSKYFKEKDFHSPFHIGNHRKYFRCMNWEDKVDCTVKVLASYKEAIEVHGSQEKFFELNDKNVAFDLLYKKMKDNRVFTTRLPRFDHLERLSRIHKFYVTPDRFFAEESTGPLKGLKFLFFGEKDCSKDEIKNINTINRLNKKMGSKYTIPSEANFRQIIKKMEQWITDEVRKKVFPLKRKDKAFIFDFESCLCNWQKRRVDNGSC